VLPQQVASVPCSCECPVASCTCCNIRNYINSRSVTCIRCCWCSEAQSRECRCCWTSGY
jgi:hypothetical protein